jgi:nicotinamide mononucleotide adenylyltransferase
MAPNAPDPSASSQSLQSYSFPQNNLRLIQHDPYRTPLVLVACGSFSPVTYLHLRMFEMAADFTKFSTKFEVLGGYISPVADAYKKLGLASAVDRSGLMSFLEMCAYMK